MLRSRNFSHFLFEKLNEFMTLLITMIDQRKGAMKYVVRRLTINHFLSCFPIGSINIMALRINLPLNHNNRKLFVTLLVTLSDRDYAQ